MHVVSSHRGHPHGEVVGCTDMFKDNEQAGMSRTTRGLLSIAAEVDQPFFQLYSSGVLTVSAIDGMM